MHYYELTGMVPGNFAENELEPIVKEVSAEFKKVGGDIKREDLLGRRKIAYAIDNMRHAYYFLVGAEIDPEQIRNLEQSLKLNKNLLRFLITKTTPKTEEERAREKQRMASRPEEPREKPRREKREKFEIQRKKPVPKEEKPKPKKAEPVDLEQLEKKIDEIIGEEIK